ncbi:hypothetical protein Tco_0529099 [Tanacetum coccineum]
MNYSRGWEKKGYVLDDVWEKCEQYHRIIIDSWHNKGFEEDELWRSEDEKTDYEAPFVDVKTFEVKKYSFKGGKISGMIKREMKSHQWNGSNLSYPYLIEALFSHFIINHSTADPRGDQGLYTLKNSTRSPKEITLNLLLYLIVQKRLLLWFRWISFDYHVTLGFGSIAGGLDHGNLVIRLSLERGISRVLGLGDHPNPSVGINPVTAPIT